MSKKTKSKKRKKAQSKSHRVKLQRRQRTSRKTSNRILQNRLNYFSKSIYYDQSDVIIEDLLNIWKDQQKPLHVIAGLVYLAYHYLSNFPTSPFTFETLKSPRVGTKDLAELIERSGGQPLLDHLKTLVDTYHDADYFGSALIYGINKYLNPNAATYISTPMPIAFLADQLLDIHSTDSILDFGIGVGNFFLATVINHGYHARTRYFGFEISVPMAMVAAARLKALDIDYTFSDDDVITGLANHPNEKFDKIFADILSNVPIDTETIQLVNKPYLNHLKTCDWFLIDAICDHLTAKGRGVAVVSEYLLSSPEYSDVRQHFIEQGCIESVITFDNHSLNIPYPTSVSLLVLSHHNEKVKFINATLNPSTPDEAPKPPELDLASTLGVKLAKFQKHNFSLDVNLYRPDSHQYIPINEPSSPENSEFLPPKLRTKKIIIIGQKAGHKTDSFIRGAELIGLSGESLELHLDYDDGKKMDFEKYRNNPDYAAILLGPMPHKGQGIGKYNSVADMLQHEVGFPPVIWLDKLSVHAMQNAIRSLYSKGILVANRAGLIQ